MNSNHFEHLLRQTVENAEVPAPLIKEAMLYSLFPGGKRLRPMLAYLTGQTIDVNPRCLDYIAAAVELIHCYSLIHDDLPAMDDDDQRRGKPSCHKAFDEATAILVGDGMQALAIEILLTHLPAYLPAEKVIAVVKALVHASGVSGMVSGQSLDLTELVRPDLCEKELRNIHQLKTGKLISACVTMVLAAGNPSSTAIAALQQFGELLGLVFQMQDDYLDRYLPTQLGKGRSSDIENAKITFASLFSEPELSAGITHLYNQATETLSCFMQEADGLRDLLHSLQLRNG